MKRGLTPERAGDVTVVAKGGAVQVAGQIVQGIVAFAFVAVAVRALGTDDYGLFRQVSQMLAIAAQLGLAGFNYSAMRFIAKARASGDLGAVRGSAWTAIVGAASTSMIVFVVLQVAAVPIAARFADTASQRDDLVGLIRLGAGFIPLFALTQVLRYCTQAYKTLVPSVIVGNIVQPLLRLAAASSLIVAGFGVGGAIVGTLIASAIALVVAFVMFRRILTPAERSAPAHARAGPMTRFALLQGGASLLGVQTLGLSVLILGAYGTDRDVGLLGIALALQTPATLFLGSIVNIWAPVVTDLHERGEMERLESLFRTITRWVVTFSLPVFAALIVVPDLFVDLLAGPRGTGAASLVAILAAGNIFYAGTGPTGFVLSMTGRPGINFVNSAVAVALYVGLGIAVVPTHGAVGIAVVDAIVTAVINSVRVVEARFLVGIHPFAKSLLKPVAATALGVMVLSGLVRLLGPSTPARVMSLAMAALTYLLLLKRMGMDPEEQHVWRGIKKRARALARDS
jgi:O-antigen/teichoic acid export membrane protein